MIIAPSILTADFCEIGKLVDESVNAGINWIHLDIMDGNWVVNKTITLPTIPKDKSGETTTSKNDIPDFRISIVSSQRSMVVASLGIKDLIGG